MRKGFTRQPKPDEPATPVKNYITPSGLQSKPVASFARMWPRELFDYKDGKQLLVKKLEILKKGGVYVLYNEDTPYYVGKATVLRRRLWPHAKRFGSKYYNFWNYFSVFVEENPKARSRLEGILIAAMPTANGAEPRIKKDRLPLHVRSILHTLKHPPLQVNPDNGEGSQKGRAKESKFR